MTNNQFKIVRFWLICELNEAYWYFYQFLITDILTLFIFNPWRTNLAGSPLKSNSRSAAPFNWLLNIFRNQQSLYWRLANRVSICPVTKPALSVDAKSVNKTPPLHQIRREHSNTITSFERLWIVSNEYKLRYNEPVYRLPIRLLYTTKLRIHPLMRPVVH